MPGRHAETLIDQLAVSVAEGRSVVTWCEKHGVATRTAYHWYKAERFQRLVAEYRRRAVDRAIGKMGRKLGKAVGKIVRLVEKGQDGKVKLAAAKTLIDRLLEVQSRAELRDELQRLNQRLTAHEGRGASGTRNPSGAVRPT
jgi:hypothetical protein